MFTKFDMWEWIPGVWDWEPERLSMRGEDFHAIQSEAWNFGLVLYGFLSFSRIDGGELSRLSN